MPTAVDSAPLPIAPPLERSGMPSSRRLFAVIFLGLAALITFLNREGFFATAIHEEGDVAANALQIHRAKQFRELRGNYSRWSFHHPGPAFFYVYAAGEWLLHDVTRLAPTPYNAHGYAGMLLQVAFYAAAITLLARHTRRPLLTVAVALLAGAAHFVHADRAIYSIWPPDVLLMPLLCFILACAAASVGDRPAIPVLVVAGSFLVHGHIALPLLVLPLTALTLWWIGRTELARAARTPAGRIALGLFGLFVLPLVLDLFLGRDSNAYNIWLHLRHQTDAGQTLWQSMLLYAGFFIALPDPGILNELTSASYAPFRERAWVFAAWILLLAVVVWRFRRRVHRDDHPFGRRLLLVWITGSLLTLVWGMRQDGGFTFFNSCFNHALVHALLLAGVLAATSFLPPLSRLVGWSATAAAIVAFALALPLEITPGSRGTELTVRLPALLQADPKPSAPKLITFAPEDWFEAVTLARAFQRLGIEFYVHPNFRIMFGADKILLEGKRLSRGEISVWHVVRHRNAPTGAHVLNRECALVFPAAASLPTLPTTIDFGANDHRRYPVFGLGTPFEGWIWAEGRVAGIIFQTSPAEHDIELTLTASGIVNRAAPHGQRVTLLVNGEAVAQDTFGKELRTTRWVVPRDIWNRQSPCNVMFELPDAIAPAITGRSADRRLLSLQLHRLTIAPIAR